MLPDCQVANFQSRTAPGGWNDDIGSSLDVLLGKGGGRRKELTRLGAAHPMPAESAFIIASAVKAPANTCKGEVHIRTMVSTAWYSYSCTVSWLARWVYLKCLGRTETRRAAVAAHVQHTSADISSHWRSDVWRL